MFILEFVSLLPDDQGRKKYFSVGYLYFLNTIAVAHNSYTFVFCFS